MKKTIYAKSVSITVLDQLNKENKVHSTFENGINLISKDGLIFIGSEKNVLLPFGIHLRKKDIKELEGLQKDSIFTFNKDKKSLYFEDKIIDLNSAHYFSQKLPDNRAHIEDSALNYIYKEIIRMDFDTGLDTRISKLLSEENLMIEGLRKATISRDARYIETNLRKIIGRGKGLTPSGDDMLIGLMWLNDLREFMSREFIKILKKLILEEELTTDISVNYLKAAFAKSYNSLLIDLYKALYNKDNEGIKHNIIGMIEYGHTSGRDTLSGIALGVDIIMKKALTILG